jgi:molecular chaperone DnaJ
MPDLSAPSLAQIQDDYRVLGLEPGTPLADAKRAYRRLVRRFHPDVSAEPQEIAAQKTRQLLEAFGRLRALGDSELTSLRRFFRRFTSEVAEEQRRSADERPNQPFAGRRGRDIVSDLEISLRQALAGSRWRFEVATCRACAGWGAACDTAFEICPDCGGIGRQRRGGLWNFDRRCSTCNGHGGVFAEVCRSCGGNGDSSTFSVSCLIPATDPRSTVLRRLTGLGHRGLAGGAPGDLYLRITTRTKLNQNGSKRGSQ